MKKSKKIIKFLLITLLIYDITNIVLLGILFLPRDTTINTHGDIHIPAQEIMWIYSSNVTRSYYCTKFIDGTYIIEGTKIPDGPSSLISSWTIFQEPPQLIHISAFSSAFLTLRNIPSIMNLTLWVYDSSKIIINNASLFAVNIQDIATLDTIENSTIEKICCKGKSKVIINNSTINLLVLYESTTVIVQNSTINEISVYDRSNLTITGSSQISILKDGIYANSSLTIGSNQTLTQDPIKTDSIIGSYFNTTEVANTSQAISRYWAHITAYGAMTLKIENYSYNGSVPINIRAYNNTQIELKNMTAKNNMTGSANGEINAFDSSNITIMKNSTFGKLYKYNNGNITVDNSTLGELYLKLQVQTNVSVKNSTITLVRVSGKSHFKCEDSIINKLNYGIYCELGTLEINENGTTGLYTNTTEIINCNILSYNLTYIDCYGLSETYLLNLWNFYPLNISTWDYSNLYVRNCSTTFNITAYAGSRCQIRDSSIYNVIGWNNSRIYIYDSNLTEANAFYLIPPSANIGGILKASNSNIENATSIFRKYSSESVEHPGSAYSSNMWIFLLIKSYYDALPLICKIKGSDFIGNFIITNIICSSIFVLFSYIYYIKKMKYM